MISLISALVAEVQPLDFPLASGGLRGTTIGPATPALALWIWAPVAGRVMSETVIFQQIIFCPGLNVMTALPLPSGSAGPGTSAEPARVALNGRPPWWAPGILKATNPRDRIKAVTTRNKAPFGLVSIGNSSI